MQITAAIYLLATTPIESGTTITEGMRKTYASHTAPPPRYSLVNALDTVEMSPHSMRDPICLLELSADSELRLVNLDQW